MTQYFGVIGNRDYIKIRGDKRPYWEFLDIQPDGWLSSLVYKRRDVPHGRRMIWDCGAWSYKDKVAPDYTPASALAIYEQFAPHGSIVIAPDHMLIEGADLNARRAFNRESAARFLDLCPPHYEPMAAIHGQNIDERIRDAEYLLSLGYQRLAIGGVAARAAQKTLVIGMVAALREVTRGAFLHVLGLSSPPYMKAWRRLGVDSCDGSSHFKQAFTGGAFFTVDGAQLTKHAAVRPGEVATAPSCDCTACRLLREDGIDTRSYGSNENNMGRAAHNQNMLMRAQQSAMRQHIVLVACCGPKLPDAAPAADLYQSALFKKSREWAQRYGDRWFILSAKHGLVDPGAVLEPYDETLAGRRKDARMQWADCVSKQLANAGIWQGDTLTVLAGNDYCDWIPLTPFHVDRPMQGLGIGQQLAWLTAQNTGSDNGQLRLI